MCFVFAAAEEAGDRGRRGVWQDVPADRVQQRRVPGGLRAHRVRDVRGRH